MSFCKIADGLDVSGILSALDRNPHLWDENPQRRAYEGSPHKEMVDIWVRFGKGQVQGDHDSEWYDSEVAEAVKPIAFKIMSLVDGERLGGILITKLPAGGKILPHIDSGWHAGYYEKFYVALKPNGVFGFECGDIESKQGDCYMFKNDVLHWVTNDTDEERISMIVCIKTERF